MDSLTPTDYRALKEAMWEAFVERDFEEAARSAASILQSSFALDAIHVAGLSLTSLGRLDEGVDWMCASLSLAAAKADWFANAAIACIEKKDFVHAMLFVQNGHKEFPEDIRLSYMRGLVMCHAQQWDQAIAFLDETLQLDPTFYHSRMSRGFCLHMLGRYDEAIECYQAIENAGPVDHEEVINNWACVLLEQAKPLEALALLDTHYPNSKRPGTLYNRSFIYLGMGWWPEAWHRYRTRATIQGIGDQGVPTVSQPIARDLDDIRGRELFLYHEQGLGDSLQFVRYARLLQPYVHRLCIAVPKQLHRLVENLVLDEPFDVVSDAEADKYIFESCDIAIPMLDAPALLDTTVETIPARIPYFSIPDEIISQRLLPDGCNPKVGLCWAGASRLDNMRAASIDKRRSIPFELMRPILDVPLLDFVSLQLPDHRVEWSRLLQPLQDGFDLLDTAGVIAQLDLVITIDSAIAHLAGALGKPVWMFSRFDGCWRWLWDGRTDTPWYPTLRIYQQKAHGTWPGVISRVVEDLKQLR